MRTYFKVRGDRAEEATGEVVREQPLTLYINGQRFLTLLCSPMKLEALIVGYLWMEKGLAWHPRRRARRAGRSSRRRRGRGTTQCRRQGEGRGAASRNPNRGPHSPVDGADLLRDAAQGRPDGRADRCVSHVADRDGGRARRAAQRDRVWLRASRRLEPLHGRGPVAHRPGDGSWLSRTAIAEAGGEGGEKGRQRRGPKVKRRGDYAVELFPEAPAHPR